MKPLVSICIPSYNNEGFIQSCIQSVLDQTYVNVEVLIADNKSTDNSWRIIQSFTDSRVRSVQNRENIGMIANFNKVRSMINGDFALFLSSDDKLKPHCIETLLNPLLLNENLSFSFGEVEYIGGSKEKSSVKYNMGISSGEEYIHYSLSKSQNLTYLCSSLFRVQTSSEVEIVNNVFFDWSFWLSLAQLGDVYYIDETLSEYRFHNYNETKRSFKGYFWHYNELKNAVNLANLPYLNLVKECIKRLHCIYLKHELRSKQKSKPNVKKFLVDKDVSLLNKIRNYIYAYRNK